jgi:hypothetical protein
LILSNSKNSVVLCCEGSYLKNLISQPEVLQKVGTILNALRKEYERDFAEAIISPPGSDAQQRYREGLTFLACFFIGMFFIWGIILLILKVKGSSVGCAAGYAFGMYRIPRRNRNTSISNGDGIHMDDVDGTMSQHFEHESTTNVILCESTSQDGILSLEHAEHRDNNQKVKEYIEHPWRRERFAQLCFLYLCSIALLCAILTFSNTLKPFVDTINDSEHVVQDVRELVNETSIAFDTLALTSEESQKLIGSLTLDYEILCPNFTEVEIEATLGVDLKSILDLMTSNYSGFTTQVSENIADINEALMESQEFVVSVGNSFHTARRYLWIIPTILFPLSFAIVVVMIGGFLAMRRQSTQDFQNTLSKLLLPSLIFASFLCFILATVFAITTAVGSDACLAGSPSGSPYNTIASLLNVTNSTQLWYQYALDYTSGCSDGNPNDYIAQLDRELQQMLNFIWKSLSQVDSVGQGNLVEYCGADNRLIALIDASRDLAKLLYTAQRAATAVNATLSCESIYPIYDSAVNELICSDTVSASAWGFVLFLCMGIATMGVISLRASWRYTVAEEKVFDENEVVAENIILDEHEEYLHYISAYKHEWEEYRGVNGLPEARNHEETSTDSSSTEPEEEDRSPLAIDVVRNESSTVDNSDMRSEATSIEVLDGHVQDFNPYPGTDSESISTSDNISFLSLNVSKTFENDCTKKRTIAPKWPSSLLRENSCQERDDLDDHLPIFPTFVDESYDDEDRTQPDTTHDNVVIPKSQVQIIKTKYRMIPSTMGRPETTMIDPSSTIRVRPSIAKILDELEELSTTKLSTPNSHRNSTNGKDLR